MDPLLVGLLAAAVSLGGAGRPSFWYDEAATISASYSRSLDQLWQMLGNVDAVHGLYYVLMHGWFTIVPPTEFWSRAPSGLAVGGAAAGVVVLGRAFSSRTVAVSAGIVCGILPRATWAGIEARPYALSMMAAVWLTVLLVHAARRDNAWLWVSYGAVLATSILLDVYLTLMVLAHTAFLCIYRRNRTVLVRFAITSVLTGCAVTPFVLQTIGQAHQIIWVSPIGRRTIEDVAVQQYFERSPLFMLVSAIIVATAIVLWRFTSAQLAQADRQLLTVAIAWLVIPDRTDPRVVGADSPDLHASLPVFHRACGRTGSGRLHRRIGGHPMGGDGHRECACPRRCPELSSYPTWSVREVRHGLQPGGGSDRREGRAW